VEDIKIMRLGWEGHIIRMEEERVPKRVLNENFHTTRPVGRPRTRWADVVQRDALQLLGIRRRRSKAANRDEWRCLMTKAKARKCLERHIWMDDKYRDSSNITSSINIQ
jgi:DnaJ-domain-containing protein 1